MAKVEPADAEASAWKVTLASGESRIYRGVVIANGHHWDPSWPKYPGQFDGVTLHSAQYKTPDVFAGKRVLVIGAGNSGCDIAVESALVAARTFHSLRRGYHFIPKFIRGKPADRCGEFLLRWHVPLWLRRRIISRTVFTAIGRPEDYGLPAPDHKLLETHPIVNSQMLYFVGHGRIKPKPDVAELCGDRVKFVDGTYRTNRRDRLRHGIPSSPFRSSTVNISIGTTASRSCSSTCFILGTTICLSPG